jgi:ornithine cyclodeaminase
VSRFRILSGDDVRALLPMDDCIALMGATLAALSAGEALAPLRSVMGLPGTGGRLGVMPGAVAGAGFGAKLLSLFPDNPRNGLSSHLGVVLLFEPVHGVPVGLVDAAAVTAIRTAAVSGLATRLLANPDAGHLAILGSGEQAASHLQAMACARPLRRVRVWSRSADHARAFVEREAAGLGAPLEVAETPAQAVFGADLICTCTASSEPILHRRDVAQGAHVNAVGASTARSAEIDESLLLASRFFVDLRASAEAEAGEYLQARAKGSIGADHIVGELGEVVSGAVEGRRSAGEITLFKSLGVAPEDIAVASFVLERAEAAGRGVVAEL